jgi:hypothetical protein
MFCGSASPQMGWRKLFEFLTHKTTCANVMSKKITSKNICQKTPPLNGGTPAQATRGTCRLGQRRHPLAANTNSGTLPA